VIEPLFVVPIFKYQCKDWDFKKKKILSKIERKGFQRSLLQTFNSNRSNKDSLFMSCFVETFAEELKEFAIELGVNDIRVTDVWTVRYDQDDYQGPHNHRSYSYSGILYAEYDSKVHQPTIFVGPWNDPVTDTTQLSMPQDVQEGTIVFFPSVLLHYVPQNKSHKKRTIISFDLLLNK
jgi:hypothetical protein